MDPVDRLALLKAVKDISPETLNYILTRGYSQNMRKTSSQTRKEFASYKYGNIARYLSTTYTHGENPDVVAEILAAHRHSYQEPVLSRAPGEENYNTLTRETTDELYGEILDQDYLDTVECTTTRNCLFDLDFLDVPPPSLEEQSLLEPEVGSELESLELQDILRDSGAPSDCIEGVCDPLTFHQSNEKKASYETEDALTQESKSELVTVQDLIRSNVALCNRPETHESRSSPVAIEDVGEKSTGDIKKALETNPKRDLAGARNNVSHMDTVTVARDPCNQHGEKLYHPVVMFSNTAENRPSVVLDN